MKNAEFKVLIFFLVLISNFELRTSFANELTVDKRTMQMDDTVTISVILENEFTNVDTLRVPLVNLAFDGPPSVSSEFQWIGGQTSRRKVFTYTAHATASVTRPLSRRMASVACADCARRRISDPSSNEEKKTTAPRTA